jgi:hypothetical protein
MCHAQQFRTQVAMSSDRGTESIMPGIARSGTESTKTAIRMGYLPCMMPPSIKHSFVLLLCRCAAGCSDRHRGRAVLCVCHAGGGPHHQVPHWRGGGARGWPAGPEAQVRAGRGGCRVVGRVTVKLMYGVARCVIWACHLGRPGISSQGSAATLFQCIMHSPCFICMNAGGARSWHAEWCN